MAVLRQVDNRGTVTLPLEMRQGLDLVSIEQRPDGVIELRPQVAVDKAQAWFWSESWQAREREVDVAIAGGDLTVGSAEKLAEVLTSGRPASGAEAVEQIAAAAEAAAW